MPLILVEWVDATSSLKEGTFEDLAAAGGLDVLQDIGFFVCKRRSARTGAIELVLATSRCIADGDFRWIHTIPYAWITNISILTPQQRG